MARHYYSDLAVETTLTTGISNSATVIVLASTVGWPTSYPFYAVIDRDGSMEVVACTSSAGANSYNVTRAQSSTVAVAHSSSVAVQHDAPAAEFNETSIHVNATSGVHGLSGDLVGRTDTQTLTGKTMDGGSNTFTNLPESAISGLAAFIAAAPVITVFTATGTFTPAAGFLYARVVCIGGGASGGGAVANAAGASNCGGGGGAGGYAEKIVTAADVGASKAVTVGAVVAGTSGASGTSGNASSFGSLVVAAGGAPGVVGTTGSSVDVPGGMGGAGGAGSTGTILHDGGGGETGLKVTSITSWGGRGGASPVTGALPKRGAVIASVTQAGAAGMTPGGGGNGANAAASASAQTGGTGARGEVIVYAYYSA